MAIFVKVNNIVYATDGVDGYMRDSSWDNRESKTIHLHLPYEEAKEIFHEGTIWSIVQTYMAQKMNDKGQLIYLDENGNETTEAFHFDEETQQFIPNEPVMVEKVDEFDNSEFTFAGDIIDHRNGKTDVKMGKQTDLEEAYEMLFG